MITNIELINSVDDDLRGSAVTMILRLPVVVVKKTQHGGANTYYFDKKDMLEVLKNKQKKAVQTSKAYKARGQMIKYIKGKNNEFI